MKKEYITEIDFLLFQHKSSHQDERVRQDRPPPDARPLRGGRRRLRGRGRGQGQEEGDQAADRGQEEGRELQGQVQEGRLAADALHRKI